MRSFCFYSRLNKCFFSEDLWHCNIRQLISGLYFLYFYWLAKHMFFLPWDKLFRWKVNLSGQLDKVTSVDIRMSKPIENCIRIYLSQTSDMPGSKILKMPQRMAVLQFFLYIWNQRRDCKEAYVKFSGGRLRWEKARWGNPYDWIKR